MGEERNNAIIMVGIPGSGKSTYVDKYIEKCEQIKIFSTDRYREKLTGDVQNQSSNNIVFYQIYNDMETALIEKKDVVFDATNVTVRDRRRFIELANKYNALPTAIVFNTDIDVCIERVAQRGWSVDAKELCEKFQNRFVSPTINEGFTYIINGNLVEYGY